MDSEPREIRAELQERLEAWREELLDLSRRNRLLNFRHTKASTLEVREPGYANLLGRLARGIDFAPLPAQKSEEEAEEDGTPVPTPAPRGPRAGILTQRPFQEQLDKALTRLRKQSRTTETETGIWILYLGVGFLRWKGQSEQDHSEAPLLLVPVELNLTDRGRYRLAASNAAETLLNPALGIKLQEFGIDWSAVEKVPLDEPEQLITAVRKCVSEQRSWSVEEKVVLAPFTFHKETMYRDLKDNEDAVLDHPIVQAVAASPGNHIADSTLEYELQPLDRLDHQQEPETAPLVLDADAYQRRAVAAALDGRSFVLDGPPGTGKSQTIANLVAALIGAGRTVLFVSEKAAALEVVHSRLVDIGIDIAALALHDGKTKGGAVAKSLHAALHADVHPLPANLVDERDKARALRARLTDHAEAVNETDPRIGLSLNQAMGRIAVLSRSLPADTELGMVDPDPGLFERQSREWILDTAHSMTHVWDLFTVPENSRWYGIQQAQDAHEALVRALATLNELAGHHNTLRRITGGRQPDSPKAARRWVPLLKVLAERDDVPERWVVCSDFDTEVVPQAADAVDRLTGLAWLRERTEFDWRSVKDLPTLAELDADTAPVQGRSVASLELLTGEQADNAIQRCTDWIRRLAGPSQILDEAVRRTGLPVPTDRAGVLRIISVLAEVSSGPHPLPHWLTEVSPEYVRSLLTSFAQHRDRLTESRSRAQDLFHSGVLERHDIGALVDRLRLWQQAGELITERRGVPARWLAFGDFGPLVREPVLAARDRWKSHRFAVEDLGQLTDVPWNELPDFDTDDPTAEVVGLDTESTAERARTDARFFGGWATRLAEVSAVADAIAQALACPRPDHPRRTQAFLEAAVGLGTDALPLPAWLGEEEAEAARMALDDAEQAVAGLREARAVASELFSPGAVEEEGLEELNERLSGYGRFDRMLGSAFREDKRRAATMTLDGSWDKRVPERLTDVIRWQHAHRHLAQNSAAYQARLGHHWRGEETDFTAVRACLRIAVQLRQLLPVDGLSGLRRFLYQGQPLDPTTVAGARAALDELAPWEEAARQLLPSTASLFELSLGQAAAWLVAGADRLTADAALADTLTPVVGPVSTGTARAIRDCVLRARHADRDLRRHEVADQSVLATYRELLDARTRQELVDDLDWAERVSQELRAAVEPVLGPDRLDIAGIESLRAQTHTANTDEGMVGGALGRACHQDRALAASLSHSGGWDDGLNDRISDAQRWYEDHQGLWGQADVLGQAFGRYWRGEETDTALVTAALDRADLCRAELQEEERAELARFLEHGDLTDLAEDLDQARQTWSAWPRTLASLPGGSAQAHTLAPGSALSWLKQVRVRMEHLRDLLRRFRDATGRDVKAVEADREITLARRRDAAETELELHEHADREVLGSLYRVDEKLDEALQDALSWTRRARRLVGDAVGASAQQWPEGAVPSLRVKGAPDDLAHAVDEWEREAGAFASLFDDLVRPTITGRLSGELAAAEQFLFALREDVSSLERWSTALAGLEAMRSHGLGPLLERYAGSGRGPERWPDTVERAVLRAWTDRRLREDERVRREPGPVRDNEVQEFRKRDRRLHTWARQEVLHQWSDHRPPMASYSPGLGVIRREAEKKRRHMPVRKLMEEVTWEAQLLTPCLMMSPLTVSMFLPSDMRFDVVVFDEASQVKPADAINCVYRGRSLIVAGDQKQLPPTGFFDRATTDDEWDEEQQETYESLLDMCKASGRMRDIPLRWHYRSRHEDLIAFSNRKFYSSELITFPGAHLRNEDTGVAFVRVEGGLYDRGGARNNRIEACKVAERVVHHFRTRPDRTLGVVALSREQANAIEDAVDKVLERFPELRPKVEGDRLGGFFVKNLETVQGDERDVIILSVGYGPTADGRIHKNFGPINRGDGHRRLNVAITRAKRRVEVVSSFSADDLRVGPDDAEGLRRLCEYLRYAEHGPAALEAQPVGGQPEAETESPFEDSVLAVLQDWGYEVQPQVGVAGYRVDLGVIDPDLPGRYVIGVECDGAMYHSSKVARDRDRLRDGVLEGLGWRLHRIWGTDWYRDRARAQERLREAVEGAVRDARAAGGRRSSSAEVPVSEDEPAEERTPDLVRVPDEKERARAAEQAGRQRPDWLVDYVTHDYRPHEEGYWYEPRSAEARPYIAGLFLLIVENESPVELGWLYRKTLDALGGERLGSTVRANFDVTLKHLLREGRLVRDDSTIWWPGGGVAVRRPFGSAIRKISEVPSAERQEALRLIVRDSARIARKDLLRSMRETFEWGRSGKDISQAFDHDLEVLLGKGVLVEEEGVVRPADTEE
ncbi:DUF4011 domain-containing protein [Nocardiopsis sp. YSL2]|uniref:DUF4011 domain-containing protein n=1 Tax=Nocardiopsis sp. YSL2 TaxID=2939492 RepID=UPI0026F44345|nr:DUF4011 domain-containing protein [Nocardiopsis sp. YSL2]